MAKEVLQITISERKAPKTKFGRWLYWKVWFQVWSIWRPKVMSKIFKALSNLMLLPLSKEKRAELNKEFEEIEVQIVNETMNKEMTQEIKDALTLQYGVDFDEEEFEKRLREEYEKLLN